MKGMNEAHRAAKLKRMEQRKSNRKNKTSAAKKTQHTLNAPLVNYVSWVCNAPTAWRLFRERCRTFNARTGCFEYLYKGVAVSHKTLRAQFLCA